MPTELGPAFPPDYQGLPTHMSTEDYSLWLRFQPTIARAALHLYFDVRLGANDKAPSNPTDPSERGWWQVNAKRADVLIEYADHLDMVELRTNAQPNAIGRLLTYRMLWHDAPALPKPLTVHLVTDRNDPDVRRLAGLNRIDYTVFPTPI